MNANFRGKGESPTNDFWHQKSRVPELSYGEKKLPKSLTSWVGCTNVTDRQTDRQQTDRQTTDGRLIAYSKRNVIRWRLLIMEPMGQRRRDVWSSSRHLMASVGGRTVLTGSELYILSWLQEVLTYSYTDPHNLPITSVVQIEQPVLCVCIDHYRNISIPTLTFQLVPW